MQGYETDKGLWNTIKKWFEDLVAKLKKLFADLDPQSENGRIVREMGDRLDAVKQMWADMVVKAGTAEESGSDSMVKSSKKDFEDYDKPITLADVEILRSIGRKSINAFSAEEIKNTQKWAYKFYQDLKTKSPFFRAWFGEWRAHQLDSFVDVVETKNRVGKNPRGIFVNNDTGWKISSTSVGYDETTSHSGKNKKSIIAMQNIDAIIENAILFDTEVSEYGKGKKSFYTAFMHKFYAPIDIDGKLYIAKMAVEESYVPKQDETHKKFYHVRSIQIETVSSVGIGKSHTPIMDNTVSKYSIADLHELVKTFDKEFTPAPEVDKVLLNEDGTPKKFYHGTDAKFTEFKPEEMSHKEGSYFFAENREDAEAYGKNIYEVYLTGRKLADYDNQPSEFYKLRDKRKQVEWLKERGYDGWYADMDSGGWGELSVFSPEQIKSAKGNIGTFSKYETDTKYSRKTVDPITSREALAKALSKVAKGEDRAIVESYKANVNLVKGETARLESLRKEIDEIKYKKSFTYEGRELSVKEFEQIAYTRAEERGSM